ncbi:MAG: methyl-accepting chemotaxis protein [Lachnospiraceae bacterium]|jgi:Methyl-accepting chemotaxis protein
MDNKFRLTLKKKILALTILPVFLLGAIVIIMSVTVVKNSMVKEIREALQSAATATFAAYDQNPGDYMQASNGNIWKGSYNISKSESLVDSISQKTGMEVTFFYGDSRIMTSAKDKEGKRILGSKAGEKIRHTVLEGGMEYFSSSVSIDGTMYYGYYIPVFQSGAEKPVGMVFVGANKADKDAVVDKIVNIIIITVCIVMACCIFAVIVFSNSITTSVKKGITAVQQVATGNLGIEIDTKLIKQQDETGDLYRAIEQLKNELVNSIEAISDNTKAVLSASEELDSTTTETNQSMQEVEIAVNNITQSALQQAGISETAYKNVNGMGKKIEQTANEMKDLEDNAAAMRVAEDKMAQMIKELINSNKQLQKLINEIGRQTKQTNESAQKISNVTKIIASIAEETTLLSLNASIEAARAGESGKGFAVVASQIQKLASQSNESSQGIEEIVTELIEDSNRAVVIMENVMETIDIQSGNMQKTEVMTGEVMERLNASVDSMEVIEKSVSYLDNARKEIVSTVSELSNIAGQNAAVTQEVSASTDVLAEHSKHVAANMEELRNIAGNLKESIGHFRV